MSAPFLRSLAQKRCIKNSLSPNCWGKWLWQYCPTTVPPRYGINGLLLFPKNQKNPEKNSAWNVGGSTGSPFFARRDYKRYLCTECDPGQQLSTGD
ncbi:hypothetical protein TNCT_142241 [Trichonephila clavata]|uniref:Uncharacterized protein n=1 Tax=Trichonephila clavata TaxID=2740835 RepID=A0A8X6F8B0_TRICU|nr:hypothetical protein TNCT_142241 [Trichonephila clavata]